MMLIVNARVTQADAANMGHTVAAAAEAFLLQIRECSEYPSGHQSGDGAEEDPLHLIALRHADCGATGYKPDRRCWRHTRRESDAEIDLYLHEHLLQQRLKCLLRREPAHTQIAREKEKQKDQQRSVNHGENGPRIAVEQRFGSREEQVEMQSHRGAAGRRLIMKPNQQNGLGHDAPPVITADVRPEREDAKDEELRRRPIFAALPVDESADDEEADLLERTTASTEPASRASPGPKRALRSNRPAPRQVRELNSGEIATV